MAFFAGVRVLRILCARKTRKYLILRRLIRISSWSRHFRMPDPPGLDRQRRQDFSRSQRNPAPIFYHPSSPGGGYTSAPNPNSGPNSKGSSTAFGLPRPLAKPSVETAAGVATLQPVTAYEIQAARKVRRTDAVPTLLRHKIMLPSVAPEAVSKPSSTAQHRNS